MQYESILGRLDEDEVAFPQKEEGYVTKFEPEREGGESEDLSALRRREDGEDRALLDQVRRQPRDPVATLVRKVDVRLPGKGDSNSHGARPVRLIITMIKWIRTSRLSIKNSL